MGLYGDYTGGEEITDGGFKQLMEGTMEDKTNWKAYYNRLFNESIEETLLSGTSTVNAKFDEIDGLTYEKLRDVQIKMQQMSKGIPHTLEVTEEKRRHADEFNQALSDVSRDVSSKKLGDQYVPPMAHLGIADLGMRLNVKIVDDLPSSVDMYVKDYGGDIVYVMMGGKLIDMAALRKHCEEFFNADN
jgi:hypothetical protein